MIGSTHASLPPQRDPALDWLRGILVLFVLVLHAEIISGIGRDSVVGYLNMSVGPILMPVFFVLSGMLGRSAIRRTRLAFFSGTVLRLLWPYFIWGLIYVLAVTFIEQKFEFNWQAFALLFTRPAMLGPVWYLAYLAVFFLVARCLRIVPAWVILLILIGATMPMSYFDLPFTDALLHATAFFAGLTVSNNRAVLGWFSASTPRRAVLPLVICVLVVAPYFFSDGLRDNGLFVIWILFASVVVVAGARRLYVRFGSSFITKMGVESLTFYLTHWPIMLMVHRVNSEFHLMTTEVAFWVALALSVAAGLLFMKVMRISPVVRGLFEAPRLAWNNDRGMDAVTPTKRSQQLT